MCELFSQRLKSLRGARTKSEFARSLGVSAQVYQRYEEGRIPRADTLADIAERLNVSVKWLLYGEPVIHGSGPPPAAASPPLRVRDERDDAYGSPECLRRENAELRERLAGCERREAELLEIIRNLTAPGNAGRAPASTDEKQS